MAPLFDAFDTRYVGSKDGLEVYGGEVDPNWSGGRYVAIICFDVYGRLVLTWHLTGSSLEVSALCV